MSNAKLTIYFLLGFHHWKHNFISTSSHFSLVQFTTQTPSSMQAVIHLQIMMNNKESNSWVWHFNSLLKDYRLPCAFSLISYQPPKDK